MYYALCKSLCFGSKAYSTITVTYRKAIRCGRKGLIGSVICSVYYLTALQLYVMIIVEWT